MCGIAGYIGRKKLPQVFIKNTLRKMSNRGPDNQNFFYYQNDNGYLIDPAEAPATQKQFLSDHEYTGQADGDVGRAGGEG